MARSKNATIGDYVTLQRGKTYSGKLVGKPGPALLGLGSIEPGGGFRAGAYKTYGGECPENLMLKPGDLYVALKGATKDGSMIGSVARLPETVKSGRLTQDTVKLEFHEADADVQRHIYWILRTPQYRQYCSARAIGSAQAALSREDFLSFPVPPITTASHALVEVLEALEDKIELNQQMDRTLEAIARAIFKSWFVDFDPVHAKAEGRAPVGMDPETAALFPDSFKDSPLGMIPTGWEVKSLDRIADFVNGAACQKYSAGPSSKPSLPVIKIRELGQGVSAQTDRARLDIPDKHRADDGDVLFSWSGTLLCRIWTGGPCFVNQHLFKVTSASYPRWFYLLWINQHLKSFRGVAAGKATTMGHIKRSHLSEALVVVPGKQLLTKMTEVMAPLVETQIMNELECRGLGTTRDSLLPRLLSGELPMTPSEEVVASA